MHCKFATARCQASVAYVLRGLDLVVVGDLAVDRDVVAAAATEATSAKGDIYIVGEESM